MRCESLISSTDKRVHSNVTHNTQHMAKTILRRTLPWTVESYLCTCSGDTKALLEEFGAPTSDTRRGHTHRGRTAAPEIIPVSHYRMPRCRKPQATCYSTTLLTPDPRMNFKVKYKTKQPRFIVYQYGLPAGQSDNVNLNLNSPRRPKGRRGRSDHGGAKREQLFIGSRRRWRAAI